MTDRRTIVLDNQKWKNHVPSRALADTIVWRESAKGNPTAEIQGVRVCVFTVKTGRGDVKYKASKLVDESRWQSSDGAFDTIDEAKRACLALVLSKPPRTPVLDDVDDDVAPPVKPATKSGRRIAL